MNDLMRWLRYTSLELFDELEKNTDIVKREHPVRLSKKVVNSRLVESETAAQNSVQHNAMSIQWKDKREVRMITFCIPQGMIKFVQSEKKQRCNTHYWRKQYQNEWRGKIRKDNDFLSCGKKKTKNSIKPFNYKS